MRCCVRFAVNAALFVLVSWAQAQPSGTLMPGSKPDAPMSLVVPYPAGGTGDVFARAIAPHFGKLLGRTVVVENISGATGSIAATKVLNSAADGSTLFLGSPNETVLAPLTLSAVKYRPEDFRLIGLISTAPLALYARADFPASNFSELMVTAKSQSAKPLSYGSTGHGSLYHLVASQLMDAHAVESIHVPYKGGAPLLQDLSGGTVDLAVLPVDGLLSSMVASGRIKALAVLADQPSPRLAQVPVLPNSSATQSVRGQSVWAGLLVPRATPESVSQALGQALDTTLQTPEIRKALEAAGGTLAAPMSLPVADRFFSAEASRLQAFVNTAKLIPN